MKKTWMVVAAAVLIFAVFMAYNLLFFGTCPIACGLRGYSEANCRSGLLGQICNEDETAIGSTIFDCSSGNGSLSGTGILCCCK